MNFLGVSLSCRQRAANLVEQQPKMDQIFGSCPIDRRRASASGNGGEKSMVNPEVNGEPTRSLGVFPTLERRQQSFQSGVP